MELTSAFQLRASLRPPFACKPIFADVVNGMVTHPLAREPAHYGPVRSMAAAVRAGLCLRARLHY